VHRGGVTLEGLFQARAALHGVGGKALERQGDLRQPGRIVRQTRQRSVVDQAHLVVEGAEEQVGLVEHLHLSVAQMTEPVQVRQQPEGVLAGRVAHPVAELQELDDEVDVEQAALAQLHARPRVTLRFSNQPPSHVVDRPAQDLRTLHRDSLQNQALEPFDGPRSQVAVPGHRPRLEERLHLPDLGARLKIVHESLERSDQLPFPAGRAESEIHAVELTIAAERREGPDGTLGPDPRPRSRLRASARRLVHEHQVQVRGVVQLGVSQPSEAEDSQSEASARAPSGPLEALARQAHGRLEGGLREIGETLLHLAERRLAIDVAQGDGGQGLLVAPAQLGRPVAIVTLATRDREE